MATIKLEKILACPRCKTPLAKAIHKGKCPNCHFLFKKVNEIWHFLYLSEKKTAMAAKEYNIIHRQVFSGPNDGSYEILGSIARGNRTVDIACGEGLLERFAPNTVGVEFSLNALTKARKNHLKYAVLADAHALPFTDNSFDISICSGSLEHFNNPEHAIREMARVSQIQVLTVHQYTSIPFAPQLYQLANKLLNIKNQPIEQPISYNKLEKMMKKANLNIIFRGDWTLPINYGRVIKYLPELKKIPACSFIISIKK